MQQIPPRSAMQQWTLLALQQLGGSGHNREIEDRVKQLLHLPDDVAEQLRPDGRQTLLDHRIAWARTHLKFDGLLDNPQRSIWTLTELGVAKVDEMSRGISDASSAYMAATTGPSEALDDGDEYPGGDEWKDHLLTRIQELSPGAFERLCQRLLRASGFVQVLVTGRPGDGGIDGQGVLQMARLVSFPVLFQCKRWQSSVGAGVIRDFRGAMLGRADRGLIIITSTFTSDARKEAIRDGAPPIDLIDGLALADNLRDLNLGVKEIVVVDHAWFDELQSWSDDVHASDDIYPAV